MITLKNLRNKETKIICFKFQLMSKRFVAESLPEAPIVPGTETTQVLNSTVFESFDNLVCIYSVQIEIASILH